MNCRQNIAATCSQFGVALRNGVLTSLLLGLRSVVSASKSRSYPYSYPMATPMETVPAFQLQNYSYSYPNGYTHGG